MTSDEYFGPLFDPDEAQRRGDTGMQLADGAAKVQAWKERAERWLMNKPQGFEFSADDLVYSIGVPDEGANKNNVVGAWFAAKNKARLIYFTGKMQKSSRISRHTGIHRVWRVNK